MDLNFLIPEPIRYRVDALAGDVHLLEGRSRRAMARQAECIGLLQQENDELRLRLGVLIRLLIQQGTLTAEQFSQAVTEAKAALAAAQSTVQPIAAAKPAPAKPGKLPKPPKLSPPNPQTSKLDPPSTM